MAGRKLLIERAMDEGKASGGGQASTSDLSEAPGGVRSVSSAELLDGDRELIIDHDGVLYRLRCTSKGKLILTK